MLYSPQRSTLYKFLVYETKCLKIFVALKQYFYVWHVFTQKNEKRSWDFSLDSVMKNHNNFVYLFILECGGGPEG